MTAVLDQAAPETMPAPSPRRGRRDAASRPASVFSVNGLLIVGSAYMVLPLLWLVFAASKSASGLFDGNALSFGGYFLANMQRLVTIDDGIFLRWLFNSIAYALSLIHISNLSLALM